MIKDELLELMKEVKHWNVCINQKSEADFTMGYYFEGQWIFFQNNERGLNYSKVLDSEEMCIEKLMKRLKFVIENQQYI